MSPRAWPPPAGHGAHRTPIDERREFPHYVYRCYDHAGRLLYVGCTYNPVARARQHRAERGPWIAHVARTRWIVWPNRRKALDMERLAIETEAPLFNKAFNRSAS
jgi:predicted GIY-YIG superfamily endonuclease